MSEGALGPTAEATAEMAEQVVRQCRVDPRRAAHTATAALQMAEQLGDDRLRAVAHRAVGNACYVGDRNAEALQHYDQAVRLFFRLGQEVEAARTLSSQVLSLSLLGRYEESLQRAELARGIFERHGEPVRLARLEINRGNVFHRLDRFVEELACYDRALAGLDPQCDSEARAAILCNRAVALTGLNRFPEAMGSFQQARDFCACQGMDLLVAQVDYNLAYLYFLRGQYTWAMQKLEQARVTFGRLESLYHLALCDLDESEIYLELNLHREAGRLADRARQQFEKLNMGYETAHSLANQGAALASSGSPGRALELFDRARELFAREKNQVWVRVMDLYRAVVYLRLGRSLQALRLASEARPYFAENHFHAKAVYSRLVLSWAHFSLGNLEKAQTECCCALEELALVEAPWLSFHCHFQLGKIHQSRRQREAARDHYRRALGMLEAMRSRIHFEELKIAFVKDKLQACERFVLLCLGDGAATFPQAKNTTAEMLHLDAFRAIEQFRARSLANPLVRPMTRVSEEEPRGSAVRRMQELRQELNSCYSRINLEEFQPGSAYRGNPAGLIRLIRHLEKQLLELFRRLAPEEQYRALQEQTPATPEQIQEVLPPEDQLLEYYLAGGTVLACVLDHDGLRFFPGLSRAARIERLLRLLRFHMSKLSLGDVFCPLAERLRKDTLEHLRQLYRELVAPLAGHLTGRHLVIAPHGFLHYLPFHALYDGRQHLSERYTISYAPSATLFRNCVLRRPEPAAYSLVLEVGGHATPHIRREAEQVERLLPNACVLRGPAATAERLRTLAERARFLHIASHAVFRLDNPMFSSIQLGDGWMTLLDVYSLRLNCELATLSGCGTGRNLVLAGDELVGLARGFLFAGAASLLVSLWDTHDETTAQMMAHFYRELRRGASKAGALQRAQAAVREQHPHPFYWAPFVLIGNPC